MLRMMIAMKTRAPVAAALAPRTQPTFILPRGLISREQMMSPGDEHAEHHAAILQGRWIADESHAVECRERVSPRQEGGSCKDDAAGNSDPAPDWVRPLLPLRGHHPSELCSCSIHHP